MRNTILLAVLSLLLVVVVVMATTSGEAQDNYDQRISNLETRVAVLESRIPPATPEASTSQQTSTSSSSQSSLTGKSRSFSATFSSNRDEAIEFEIEQAGTYQVVANTAAAATIEIVDGQAISVPEFSIATSGKETVTRSGSLAPGTYTLRVTAASNWSVTIVLLGD